MKEIVTAKEDDIEKIATCYLAAFPNTLSSALGLDYVKVMLRWYLSGDNTFLFYLEVNDRCVGFCGGMIRTPGTMGSASSMAQYSFNVAIKAFLKKPWLLFHPEVRAKYKFIFKNIFRRFAMKSTQKDIPPATDYSGLVVIGVDPSFQGKGYGSKLLKGFEQFTKQRKLKRMVLSVKSDNSQAIISYRKNNWVITKIAGQSTSMEKVIE